MTLEAEAIQEGCVIGALRHVDAFANASDPILLRVVQATSYRKYRDGETISSSGQYDGSEFFVVISGAITSARLDAVSGSMIVERYDAGEEYGIAAAIADKVDAEDANATLCADGETEIAVVDADAFRGILKNDDQLARDLLNYVAKRVVGGGLKAVTPESSGRQRIHEALMKLAEGADGRWRIPRMPKHRELAERAQVDEALAAETVARLIANGVVARDYPGLVIEDIEELRRLAK
ncbi:MAG: Crp/Fnr family transcriptional regulator [Pseudomonadota bacterium]